MKSCSLKSFTLIELIVVMGIIAFFAGMGLVTFGNTNQINSLRQVKDRVTDGLEYAKQKAKAPELYDCSTNELAYNFNLNATSYYVQRCCANPTTKVLVGGSCQQIQQYAFPANISAISSPLPLSVNFYLLNNGSNGTTAGNPIRLKNPSVNKCLDVTVSTSGAIEVFDIADCP